MKTWARMLLLALALSSCEPSVASLMPGFMDTLPSQTISRIFDVFSGYHLAQNGVLRFVNKL
jgi:hypothetical protein